MLGNTDEAPRWSVQAQLTISHPGINDPNAVPQTYTERDENGGVRVFYTWTSSHPIAAQDSQVTSFPDCEPENTGNEFAPPGYGFQRGDLFFTSTPPKKSLNLPESVISTDSNRLGPTFQDSGYSSELLSPNSFPSSSLPRRQILPYDRRCRSTCSIVLSTCINEEPENENGDTAQTHCGRTQSLRCQTPTARNDNQGGCYFSCGDPWCYHGTHDRSSKFSPVGETIGEPSYKQPTRAHTFSTQPSKTNIQGRSRSSPPRLTSKYLSKDAAVQTSEMVDKCTSPYMKLGSFAYKEQQTEDNIAKDKMLKRRSAYNSRSRTEPVFARHHSPSSFTPDSLESQEPARRLYRNHNKLYGKSPFSPERKDSASDSKSTDTSKKPRTVHIDVYCTGTEQESEGSSSDSDSEAKTASTPQTVFESDAMRVTHVRAEEEFFPHMINNEIQKNEEKTKPLNNLRRAPVDSDNEGDDNSSTAYPSQLSSYSGIAGLSSFSSSIPQSWSSYSMSSYAIPDNDYDSVANTSWKDTYSDISSMVQSRSSIAPTESLDFVPRKGLLSCQKSGSIEEHPETERKTLLATPSETSVRSDSFEYANSDDRLRIKQFDNMWGKTAPQKPWKSPHLERKHLLQQQKLKEYLEQRVNQESLSKWRSRESDSEGSDTSEKGWSFSKDDDKKLQRDVTVRTTNKEMEGQRFKKQEMIKEEPVVPEEMPKVLTPKLTIGSIQKLSSDTIRALPKKSPSFVALQQRLTGNPTLRAPFTIVPGIYTDQRFIAKRFGQVVDAFKKPGHHVGPAKNPDCLCDHCKSYFETYGQRGRARSVGEVPYNPYQNWRKCSRSSQPRETYSAV